ncbi:MAG: ParA family protein [Pseudomonadota bacterium]|nr:ParA family protein [Pseudomonadota bacterium]
MKTLSLIAQKGGTGKTTLSIHLAVQASLSGLKVLLVDIDPQASATAWWRRRREEKPELVQSRGSSLPDVLTTATNHQYDLLVVDTAPHSSKESRICARLSDWVCIPSRPAILDLDAIGPSTDLVSEIGVDANIVLNGCPPPTLFGEPHIVTEAREALLSYRIPVCDVSISQRVAFSHALIDGRAVSEYDRGGKAAREIDRLWNILREGVGV